MIRDLFSGSGADPAFVAARDQDRFADVRELCEARWLAFHHLADPHFIDQFSRDFHARFWEMELAHRLTGVGHKLTSSSDGPDFLVDERVHVEATTAERGTQRDGIPRLAGRDEDNDSVPFGSFVLRLTSRIESKASSAQARVACNAPYVIAVNLPQPEVWVCSDPPLAAQACLGVGGMTVDLQSGAMTASASPSVRKASGAEVHTRLFYRDEFRHVSGVLVASVNPFVRPFCTACEFLHNPRASRPLAHGWFPAGMECWSDGTTLHCDDHDQR